MLLPKFTLSQCEKFVTCQIHAPYTKVSDVEVHIGDFDFSFFAKPYLLKLKLPGKVKDDGSSGKYHVEDGNYVVKILKDVEGFNFEGLDMITSLLQPKDNQYKAPKIEVVSENGIENESNAPEEQKKLEDLTNKNTYGFANQKSDVFPKLMTCDASVLFLTNLDEKPFDLRFKLMQEAEFDKFDVDWYLGDFFNEENFEFMIKMQPEWLKLKEEKDLVSKLQFTDDEKDVLLNSLYNKDYLLSENEKQSVLMGLVSILFAFAYDIRKTEGEGWVESAVDIQILSATLSWCCNITTVEQMAICCFRRAITYPLYRNFRLCQLIWEDVAEILSLGTKYTLKSMLKVRSHFESCDAAPYYLLNRLYIDDYCTWLQKINHVSDGDLKDLAGRVRECKTTKLDLGWDLEALENYDYSDKASDSSESTSSESDVTTASEESEISSDNEELSDGQATNLNEDFKTKMTLSSNDKNLPSKKKPLIEVLETSDEGENEKCETEIQNNLIKEIASLKIVESKLVTKENNS